MKLQYNQLAQGTRKICVLSNTYNTEAIEKKKKIYAKTEISNGMINSSGITL